MAFLASLSVFMLILIFLPLILILYIPVRMAYVRGRSRFIWLVLSIFLTPLVTILLLAILGDGYRNRRRYYSA